MFTFKHFFLLNFHCLTYSAVAPSAAKLINNMQLKNFATWRCTSLALKKEYKVKLFFCRSIKRQSLLINDCTVYGGWWWKWKVLTCWRCSMLPRGLATRREIFRLSSTTYVRHTCNTRLVRHIYYLGI